LFRSRHVFEANDKDMLLKISEYIKEKEEEEKEKEKKLVV